MKNYSTLFYYLFLLSPLFSFSQDLPKTDIYLSNYSVSDSGYTFTLPERITDFEGYDNQPYFMPDEQSVLFTSVRENNHADIFRYNTRNKKTTNYTNTADVSEYSPQLSPDGMNLTVVRVEKDDSSQFFYKYDLNGKNEKKLIPELQPVGYYCRLNDSLAAFFVLGKPNTLQIGNLHTGKTEAIDTGIGRCILKSPKSAITFTYIFKRDSLNYELRSYDFLGKQMKTVCALNSKTEDYAWTAAGNLWYGIGGKLYERRAPYYNAPEMLFDFSATACAAFYRLVIDPYHQRIAMVSYLGKKP